MHTSMQKSSSFSRFSVCSFFLFFFFSLSRDGGNLTQYVPGKRVCVPNNLRLGETASRQPCGIGALNFRKALLEAVLGSNSVPWKPLQVGAVLAALIDDSQRYSLVTWNVVREVSHVAESTQIQRDICSTLGIFRNALLWSLLLAREYTQCYATFSRARFPPEDYVPFNGFTYRIRTLEQSRPSRCFPPPEVLSRHKPCDE